MQNILISGNLAKDCEVIQGKEGAEMLRFDVAVKDGRDKEEKPTYYTCRMKKTGIVEYLKKGRFVYILGNLKVNVVEKEGKTYVNLDVWVGSLDLALLPKES
ncbi:MAG: single-stranded DNA-binding protein [Bacteroidales bacterium]|nr:single-stranded DNA-binding protein [Bacteroidales bacterium]